ncbi:MAG: hypothetical protein ABI217_00405 [Chthoniobacterales bacterium]
MKKLRIAFCLFPVALVGATCFVPVAKAKEEGRRFTFVYEATTEERGEVESENWISWGTSPRAERGFNSLDFRQEIEFGVTDHLQIGVYLADWGYREDPAANKDGFRYQSSAVELTYNLMDPSTDLLGLALYGEVRGGPEELELESKVILQKNFGRFIIAYNGTLEAKWEGDRLAERAGEIAQSLGLSYEISSAWCVGAELLHEIDPPGWSEAAGSVVYGGPNLSYRHRNWWATVTPLVQLTRAASEVDVQTRLIFGFEF